MAGDLATMKARIASELSRSNLTDQIANAITDAIGAYQHERFRFSDIFPNNEPEFATVAGRYIYTNDDNPNISSALKYDYVLIDIGSTTQYLDRLDPLELKLYIQQNTMQGQPSWYAIEGQQLMLAPIPPQAYTITLGVFRNVDAPATDDEADNPWMTTAERLIRARAKFEIATHVTRNPTMAQAMSPSQPSENGGVVGAAYREFKLLKGDANRYTGRGRVTPMQF